MNTKVIGSFAKLLKYFKNHYDGTIITYSDLRYFDGKIYSNNGFEYLGQSSPNFYYTDYTYKYNRLGFQKYKQPKILKEYDSNLTGWENNCCRERSPAKRASPCRNHDASKPRRYAVGKESSVVSRGGVRGRRSA